MPYYIRLRGEQQGPFAQDYLQKLAARGRFGRHYEVSTDGATWSRADNYPELFPRPPAPVPRTRKQEQPSGELALALPPPAAAAPVPESKQQVEWFYTHQNEERGPVGEAEMEQGIKAGQVHADDFVWCEGMSSWRKLHELPNLSRHLAEHPAAQSAPPSTAPLAVASLVAGLLGASFLPLMGSLLAVILGHIALGQIRRSLGKLRGKEMAWAGLLLGYLVLTTGLIFVIVLVATIALSVGS